MADLYKYNLSKPGIWLCWRLESGSVALIDGLEHNDYLHKNPNTYKGQKVTEKLGFATNVWDAFCMYNQFSLGYVPVLKTEDGYINERLICRIVEEATK